MRIRDRVDLEPGSGMEKPNFCWRPEGHRIKEQVPEQDPDPLGRSMDPRIRIRTNMSRIRDTARNGAQRQS
jgi:hypothetical protein